MKKILWIVSLLAGGGVFGAQGDAALLKGEVKTYDMDGFRLHVYLTQDALGDATTVVEGRDGLVILEMPLFKENLKEFAGYLKGLGKPVVKVVADYHVGGVADYAPIRSCWSRECPNLRRGPFTAACSKASKRRSAMR